MQTFWKKYLFALVIALLSGIFVIHAQENQLYIAYVSQSADNDDIFLTNLNNTTSYNLTDARSRDWHPTWSANGLELAFTSDRSGNADIFIMNANGSDPYNVTNNPADDLSPDWSPTRNEIAFISTRDGGYDLYIYKLDIGTSVRLTVDGNPKSDPDWSPDGLQIVYWELVDDTTAQLKTINVETGEIDVLIETGQNLWAAWSPDDSTILFHTGVDGNDDILSYSLSDASISELTNTANNEKQAAWSPDSQQIVFVSNRNGIDNLYIMNADGSGVRQLSNSPVAAHSPAWQPVAVEIDFSDTALGQNVNVVQGEVNSSEQSILGVGEGRLYAPEIANLDDLIRVRFELQVESEDSDATPYPTPDIPLRNSNAYEIYRFMGARLIGLDLDKFEIFPGQTDYLLEISEDRLNYWEWYLRPADVNALGRRFLAVELYLPDVESDGTVVQTVLDTLIFEVEITQGQEAIESEYIQEELAPDPALGLTIVYSDETSLSIIFNVDTDASDMRVGTSIFDYSVLDDFPVFLQGDSIIPAGTCLFYELANAELVLPRACRNDNAYNYLLQPADIFWFDGLENRLLDVIIRYNERAYPCNASFGSCDY